jgi:endonuclease/exonuclease/phosphatase family metal-dependent hydrolase
MLSAIGLGTIVVADHAQARSEQSLNVMSFNIRYNNPDDGLNAWPYRKEFVSSLIQFHKADVVGVQEALIGQLSDLQKQLPKYSWFGVGRDDGEKAGEFTAILYRNDKFTIQKQGTFWCSPTPDIPSKGWDADLNRTVTWGLFAHNNGDRFYLFNTHFDHIGEESRAQCAKLLRKRIDSIANQMPVIITGDFNTTPSDRPYQYLTDNKPYEMIINDASKVSELKAYGSRFTSTKFNIAANEAAPIDYIFTSSSIKVARFGVLSDSFNGRLPSDHYPLLVEIYLP